LLKTKNRAPDIIGITAFAALT